MFSLLLPKDFVQDNDNMNQLSIEYVLFSKNWESVIKINSFYITPRMPWIVLAMLRKVFLLLCNCVQEVFHLQQFI